jgi:hypothetical protein
VGHLPEVKYSKERVPVGRGVLVGWTFGRGFGGVDEASGPCPTCKGDAYGPRLPDIAYLELPERPTRDPATKRVDVPCECHCGYDHGGGSEKGCGRWWTASK